MQEEILGLEAQRDQAKSQAELRRRQAEHREDGDRAASKTQLESMQAKVHLNDLRH